jgi:hypothetical protein
LVIIGLASMEESFDASVLSLTLSPRAGEGGKVKQVEPDCDLRYRKNPVGPHAVPAGLVKDSCG